MKKLIMIIACAAIACSLAGCKSIDDNIFNIKYDLGDTAQYFTGVPLKAEANETVELIVEVLYGSGIHVYVDNQEISISRIENGEFIYSFIMPEKDVTVTAGFYTEEEMILIHIVDLTEVNSLTTAAALEEFYRDSDYTYCFPSIKSACIECQFSNGETLKFTDAFQQGKVTLSDLDVYGIMYWIIDKDGNFISSFDK